MQPKNHDELMQAADFFALSPDLFAIVDCIGHFIRLNPAWETLLGFTLTTLYATPLDELVHPDDREQTAQALRCYQRGETALRFENRLRCHDGTYQWWEWSGQIDVSRQQIYLAGRDIDERKQREIALQVEEEILRENEQNLRAFFNTLDYLLFVLDGQGRIILTNESVIRRLGYTQDEMEGQNVLMVHPPQRREEAGRIVQEMLAGQADYCPVPVITKEGQLIPVETRVVQGKWSGQDVIFGVTKDLSALKAAEEKFSKIFHSSPVPMGISEIASGVYVEVNDMFLQTVGYTREEVIGHSSLELNLFAHPEQRIDATQMLQAQGHLRDFEATVRTKSGQLRYGLFSAEYIRLQDRELLLVAMNDVTERKQVEAERERLIHELQTALAQVKQLSGLLPICASCKKIRDDRGYWRQVEVYIREHSEAEFSHSICPDCMAKLYPDTYQRIQLSLKKLQAVLTQLGAAPLEQLAGAVMLPANTTEEYLQMMIEEQRAERVVVAGQSYYQLVEK